MDDGVITLTKHLQCPVGTIQGLFRLLTVGDIPAVNQHILLTTYLDDFCGQQTDKFVPGSMA